MDNPKTLATVASRRYRNKKAKPKIKTKTNTTQKTKTMGITHLTNIGGWTHEIGKGRQFMPLIRHPPYYSYSRRHVGHHYAQTNTNKTHINKSSYMWINNISQSAVNIFTYFKGICYPEWKILYDVHTKINYNQKPNFPFQF